MLSHGILYPARGAAARAASAACSGPRLLEADACARVVAEVGARVKNGSATDRGASPNAPASAQPARARARRPRGRARDPVARAGLKTTDVYVRDLADKDLVYRALDAGRARRLSGHTAWTRRFVPAIAAVPKPSAERPNNCRRVIINCDSCAKPFNILSFIIQSFSLVNPHRDIARQYGDRYLRPGSVFSGV